MKQGKNMKAAHKTMSNTAKVSLMRRFPFLTNQERGKGLFTGKKKVPVFETKKLTQPL